MIKNLLFFVCLFFFFISCNKEKEVITPELDVVESLDNTIEFEFRQLDNPNNLTGDVTCQVASNQISGSVPYLLKPDSLVAAFRVPAGAVVTVNNVVQISGVTKNDYSGPVNYVIKTQGGRVNQYNVKLTTFTGLPIINIETEDNAAIDSKDLYVNAHLKINGNAQFTQGLYDGDIQIRGRGNSTWEMPKKPYKIKLNKKSPLLGMPADKDWVLLANYSDKTLMRNSVSLELSRQLGLKYTPRSRFVEVFLNKKYLGNYLLIEQIKIADDRVNIKEMNNKDISNDLITGGYLLEIDVRKGADFLFKTKSQLTFCIKSPENIAASQFAYIKDYIQETEDVLYSDSFTDSKDGYAKYINVESFVNWYLLNEITKNNDAAFYTSVYLYKDRNGKLTIGPAWDFDIALGNINYNGNGKPEGFWIREFSWIHRLFQDPAFNAKVKERFNLLKENKINNLSSYINETAAYLNNSQDKNFKKWQILEHYVWPNAVVLGTYEEEVIYLTDWLHKRIDWMDKEFNQQL